jgi:Domain of unknown function (DUF1844)
MTDQDPGSGFEVRDRRRRPDDEPPSPVEDRSRQSAPPPASAEPSLAGLFMMLASFALAALEGVRDPAGSEMHKDPQQAAELIDMLILLRERTDGRRTPEESQVLDELLYDLQMRFVRATKPS